MFVFVVECYFCVVLEMFGCFVVDEMLYLYTEMTSVESRGRKIIGDFVDCKMITMYGLMVMFVCCKCVVFFLLIRLKKIFIYGVLLSLMYLLRGIMASGVGGVVATSIS